VAGTRDRFAVAVARAWIEPGDPDSLRVRIMTSPADSPTDDTIGVAPDIEGAVAIFRDWLRDFALDSTAPCDHGSGPAA
jgi:hypothetical protein